jgi:hypothetical protein
MTTVSSISVGRFDQNLAVKRIFPPPCSPTRSCSRCSRWPCALFVPYLVPGSQWLRVYDFLLYSMTHVARKNTENRPEDPKLWPLECLNKGSVYAHVRTLPQQLREQRGQNTKLWALQALISRICCWLSAHKQHIRRVFFRHDIRGGAELRWQQGPPMGWRWVIHSILTAFCVFVRICTWNRR